MINVEAYTEFYYDKLAKRAIERNIGFFVMKMARPGDLRNVLRGKKVKTSKYKGVFYDFANSTIKPWKAIYRRKYLGSYCDEDLAHAAYQLAVSKHKKKRLRIAA